jgi:hypothetical protein
MDATSADKDSIIGDECHIVARSPGGPRADPAMSREDLDSYPNLILLCKVHHKLVDDQPNTYTVRKLRSLKHEHEHWVREKLQTTVDGRDRIHIAPRISTGTDILAIVIGADAFEFSHDELISEEEVELVGSFLEALQDWGDFGSMVGSGDLVRGSFALSYGIQELEQKGFGVFGVRETRDCGVSDDPASLSVAVAKIIRVSEPDFGGCVDKAFENEEPCGD